MSEEYQVIARKYRPMRFSDVVGQETVTRTLMNAIKQNRTAHAYLLVGPRGVGKTTLARIFAKALNCEQPEEGEPCCKCKSCVSITEENNLDVIEIDAASRNSVDDMRSLTDEVMHMPIASKYKVYIIDEIHMLSNQAWNALLKTVEEPPAHAKFIFATTEVHKVLATIISRCQRFDLMPIPTTLIAQRLKKIADDQQIKIEDSAIFALAKAADGGMRDAQSLLDQMIAFFATGDKEHTITGEEVISLFGLASRSELYQIVESILTNNVALMVQTIHLLVQKGKNLETLFEDITVAIRGIELTKLLGNKANDILNESEDILAKYQEFASLISLENIQIIMEILLPSGRILRDSLNKQIYLETLLLKAMREAHATKINDLIERLNQLRNAGELSYCDKVPATSEAEKKKPEVINQSQVEPIVEAPRVTEVKIEAPIIEETKVEAPKSEIPNERIAEAIEEQIRHVEEISYENSPEYVEIDEVDILRDMGKVSPIQERNDKNNRIDNSNKVNEVKKEKQLKKELKSNQVVEIPEVSKEEMEIKLTRKSIINEPNVKQEALNNPDIKSIISIIDGEITDIHEDKQK